MNGAVNSAKNKTSMFNSTYSTKINKSDNVLNEMTYSYRYPCIAMLCVFYKPTRSTFI